MFKSKWLVVAGLATALALTGCSSKASKGGTTHVGASSGTKVSIMVGGLNKQIYLPFMLAQQLGYYKDQGLNIALSDEPAGVDATTNMLAGKVDGVGGFYDHTIDLQGLGQSAESVVSMLVTPGEVELCRNDLKGKIKSPADWKGRNLGITDLGSSTDFLTQYLAQKNGVDPTTIHRIGVQAGATLIGAMTHKNVDCAMTTEPTVSALLANKQAYILLDMRSAAGAAAALGGEYPATSLYMSTSYIQKNPGTVQKLVNAYVKTLKWIQDHTAAQIADMMPADYYAGVGKAAYISSPRQREGHLQPHRHHAAERTADQPEGALRVQQGRHRARTIDLSKTYTNQFVQAAK